MRFLANSVIQFHAFGEPDDVRWMAVEFDKILESGSEEDRGNWML